MPEGERVFSPQIEPFQYLWELASPGPQRNIQIPFDSPKYSILLAQITSGDQPHAMTVGIIDLLDRSRLLEAYWVEKKGVTQLQCQTPSLTGIPHPDAKKESGVWIELFNTPSMDKAIKLAEFINLHFNK